MTETNQSIGFLFPGQGSQFVGMGKDLYEQFPTAKNLYDKADDVLGYSLTKICFEGPESDLTRTLYAQPAIFVTSLAALSVLKEKTPDLAPSFVAGLSLGEFTALVAAKALTFEDGLNLVAKRASAMENAAKNNPGTMASIIGLSKELCEEVAKEAGCEVANLNSPEQTVLSGTAASIEKACPLAEEKGAKRAIPLKVGGAFHSTLMTDAKVNLEKALKETPIESPSCTFIPNATAESVSDPEQIRILLAKQLMSPVRWVETMGKANSQNLQQYLEIGPGKVLKGLARKCGVDFTVNVCGTVSDIQKIEESFTQVESKE